jgi:sporulation integral membrane protein YtvI
MPIPIIVIGIIGLIALYGLFTIGSPFLLAIVFAMFLEPLNLWLIARLKWNRLWSVTVVCTLFTLAFLGLFYLLGFNIYTQLIAFAKHFPSYLMEIESYWQDPNYRSEFFYNSFSPEVADQMNAAIESVASNISESLKGLASGISGFVVDFAQAIPNALIFFLVFFIALFLVSYQLPSIKQTFLRQFSESSREKVSQVLHNLRDAIFGFLRAQFILSCITYILVLAGLLIVGVDLPFAIALLIVIVDILPVLGTGSVLVPWAVYNFFTDDVRTAVGLMIMFVVITIIRRVLEPKVLGDSIGINPLAALVGLYLGFKLFGGVGLIFGPAVVIIYSAMRKAGLLNFKIKLD